MVVLLCVCYRNESVPVTQKVGDRVRDRKRWMLSWKKSNLYFLFHLFNVLFYDTKYFCTSRIERELFTNTSSQTVWFWYLLWKLFYSFLHVHCLWMFFSSRRTLCVCVGGGSWRFVRHAWTLLAHQHEITSFWSPISPPLLFSRVVLLDNFCSSHSHFLGLYSSGGKVISLNTDSIMSSTFNSSPLSSSSG